jgi:hypothetical protein
MVDEESQQSSTDQVRQQEEFTLKLLKRAGVRRILTGTLDPSFDGSMKVILDSEDTAAAAADEIFPVTMPFHSLKASDTVIMIEIAPGEFAVLGKLGASPVNTNQDGFWLFVTPGSSATSSTAVTGRAQRLYNAQYLSVEEVSFVCTVGGAGLTARVRLYSSDGAELILDTGDVDCTSTGEKFAGFTPAIDLVPGFYIVKFTSSAGVSVRCADLGSTDLAVVMNIGINHRATDETMATASNNVSFPIIKMQG